MDDVGLVVGDGDLASASGRLIRERASDWFEPPAMMAAVGGPRIVQPPGPVAIRVVGADFDDLNSRFERGGAVEGFATLTGVWTPGQLEVSHQTVPVTRNDRRPRWVKPPCRTPADGWPEARGHLRFDMREVQNVEAVVQVTVFHPGPGREVLVVAATDPAKVEALLRPQIGMRLCVVPSRWTKSELDAVRAHLRASHRNWGLLSLGQSADEDGQAYVAVELVRVSAEIALWAASMPRGILSLDPWLRPAPASPL